MSTDFPDGVWLVELAALADPALLVPTAASVLGVGRPGNRSLASLLGAIGTKTMLLVLDNCEHMAAACAELADSLLRAGPGLRLLVTCQEGLPVAGELRGGCPRSPRPTCARGRLLTRERRGLRGGAPLRGARGGGPAPGSR